MPLTNQEIADIAQSLIERDADPPDTVSPLAIFHFMLCEVCAEKVGIAMVAYRALLETPIDSDCKLATEFEFERRFREKLGVLR
ncbi:hypothetical protein HYW94_03100 [Candidatus Uhrbacteria bacterium]|nr:hypothetical protein [Candidatus Uhrbacteria bacterium]